MKSGNNKGAVTKRECDDLQMIEGVGPTYAKALIKIGVRLFADMSRYKTLGELQKALADKANTNVPISNLKNERGDKGDWLKQAADLVQESKGGSQSMAKNDGWQEHAYFTLIFEQLEHKPEDGQSEWQIIGHRQQNGGKDFRAEGINSDWIDWIWEHANLPPDLTPLANNEPMIKPNTSVAPASIEAQTQRKEFHLLVNSLDLAADDNERVNVTLKATISGSLDEEKTSSSLQAQIVLLLVNEKNYQSTQAVFDQKKIKIGTKKFTSRHYFPLPHLGRYQVHCLVYFPAISGLAAHHRGPILNVVS